MLIIAHGALDFVISACTNSRTCTRTCSIPHTSMSPGFLFLLSDVAVHSSLSSQPVRTVVVHSSDTNPPSPENDKDREA